MSLTIFLHMVANQKFKAHVLSRDTENDCIVKSRRDGEVPQHTFMFSCRPPGFFPKVFKQMAMCLSPASLLNVLPQCGHFVIPLSAPPAASSFWLISSACAMASASPVVAPCVEDGSAEGKRLLFPRRYVPRAVLQNPNRDTKQNRAEDKTIKEQRIKQERSWT